MDSIMQNAAAVNGVSSTAPSEPSDSRFNVLERTLEQFQENARHLGVIASDFTLRSQEPLNQKLHTMVSGLQELDQLKNTFHDVPVPIELLGYLDDGKNPQLYTRELLERTKQKNKEVNGKTEIYKKFQACLLAELHAEMPQDIDDYLKIRKLPVVAKQNGTGSGASDGLSNGRENGGGGAGSTSIP